MNRTTIQITLGMLMVVAASAIFIIYAVNEEKRMEEYQSSVQARAIEEGAELFEAQCSRCHGTNGTGIAGLCPPLNDRYFFDQRLEEIAWSGALEDYIVATVSSGRLASTRPQLYPGQGTPAMPSFSDQYGGPLREDQIRNIAAYVLNWQETAEMVEAPPTPAGPTVGTDITKELPEGDVAAGEALATSLACTACHIAAPTGPAWLATGDQPGIGTRAESRISEADYTGAATSAAQYLFEAISDPGVYIVANYPAGVMPGNYASTLTEQQMADLIAYLLSLK
jgi:mono/diheme cytochrome c family protein